MLNGKLQRCDGGIVKGGAISATTEGKFDAVRDRRPGDVTTVDSVSVIGFE